LSALAQTKPLYENNFETAEVGKVPDDFLVLDGAFAVRAEGGNRFLEHYRDQELKGSLLFEWKSGTWTNLRLQVRKDKTVGWKIEAKAWVEGGAEPAWLIPVADKEDPPAGRASIFGSPFLGTPNQFDDLIVAKASSQD
jgi:hypothetical protein